MRGSRILRLFVLLAAATAGCEGSQSALDPAGVQSGRISDLWWLYVAVTGVVYVLVLLVILAALARRGPRQVSDPPDVKPDRSRERRKAAVVAGAVLTTALILLVLTLSDFLTGRAIAGMAHDADPLTIRVTGRQWWWEVEYREGGPSDYLTTANEIHLPVGRTVQFELQSPDVIHSFWVPNLHGKTDLIPGHPTRTTLRADRPGTYWGRCAEFCGHQHANMRFVVVVEPPEQFHAWLDAQKKPAAEPTTDSQRQGREVFLGTTCVMCHSIQGTNARGRVGPDLTHVASRPRIGAGTLPTTRGHLAGWVLDPQRVKPGVHMPVNPLSPEELRALVDYLEKLK